MLDLEQPGESHRFVGGVDIHSHPLPAIDDGAAAMADSIKMLAVAARFGTTLMVATPHRYWGSWENDPDRVRRLTDAVRLEVARTGFGRRIELHPGQEIPLTLNTAAELRNGEVMSLGDNRAYALVEPPFEDLPKWMAEALTRISDTGIRPVLAHPERNAVIQRNPELAAHFVAAGALLQLTAMSLTGENGSRAQAAAHSLLDLKLATAIASDSHSPTWRPPTLRPAYHALVARHGEETARTLCASNPRRIALGQSLP